MTHATVQCTNVDENPILTRIHAHGLWIDPTTGEETFANVKGMFRYVDPNFMNWGTNKPSKATKGTFVAAYTIEGDASVGTFDSLGDLSDLALTQGQIIQFCRVHANKLSPAGDAALFLFGIKGKCFVSDVRAYECGFKDTINVHIYRPCNIHNWGINSRLWLAVPQP